MPTQCQHNANTKVTLHKEYKKERIKESLSDGDARAHARENFDFFESEKSEQKENEQKKVEKESFITTVLCDEVWLDAIRRKFKLSNIEVVKQKVNDFELDLICRGKEGHKDEKDFKCHFYDWLKGNLNTTSYAPSNSAYSQKERWAGEYYVPKSSEGGIYDGKI